MEWNDITVEELQVNMTRAANWKSPGPDKLPNFWIKQFKSLHRPLAIAYSVVINDPQQIPEWLVEGTTNLLPKKEETWIPKNYRPIACLPTTFKILTSVITDRLYNHLENESIMTPEQRGGKKDCYGCKDQLMINNAILENCKAKKKNVSTAWIDYKKAFDSVPHSWILRCLQMYKKKQIIDKNLLTTVEIDEVKQEVDNKTRQEHHDQETEEEQIQPDPAIPVEPVPQIAETHEATTQIDLNNLINDNNDEYNELKDEYVDLRGKVKAQPLEARQKLPKLKNDKRLKRMINILDKVVEETSQDNMDLTTINQKQYTAALLITNKILPPKPHYKKTQRGRPPAWQQRLQRQIDQLRGEISIITEYTKGNSTKKTRRKLKKILKKHKVASEDQLTACKEDLKQALQSKAQRLRRYIKRSEQYKQNKRFRDDTKRFYRELGKKAIQIETPPDIVEVKKFWQNILEQEVKHNEDAQWIKDQEEQLQINQMEWNDITVEELQVNMTRAANWKSPGPDKLPNFWIKQFKSLHRPLAIAYSVVINDPQQIPEWLVEGTTNLLPKKEETWIPKNYRPIACLPTTFKILTSVITDRLYNHLENESIMTPEQRGGKKDCYGCKDQLMINNAILENCKAKKKNVSTAWIDYKKAFDSVPHSCILRCLQMYKKKQIIDKNLLTTVEIDEVKQEVDNKTRQEHHDQETEEEQIQPDPAIPVEPVPQIAETHEATTQIDLNNLINDNNDEYNELKDEYVDLLGKVKAQPLEARQKLPKLKNDKRLKRMINILDKVVEETSQDNMDLTTINQKQYTAVLLITNKILPPKPHYKKTQRGRPPAWQQRLQRQIDQLRGEISIITEYTKGNSTNKTRRKLKKILKKHKVASEDQLTAC